MLACVFNNPLLIYETNFQPVAEIRDSHDLDLACSVIINNKKRAIYLCMYVSYLFLLVDGYIAYYLRLLLVHSVTKRRRRTDCVKTRRILQLLLNIYTYDGGK